MKTIRITIAFMLLTSLFFYSCNKDEELTPEQEELYKMYETNILLRNNTWGFYDMKVSVQKESRAIPLLANVADENGMIKPGIYDSYDIFGSDFRQKNYSYQITDQTISQDISGQGDYNPLGTYFLLSSTDLRIIVDTSSTMRFGYQYNEEKGIFKLQADQARHQAMVYTINQIISKAILSGELDDLAQGVVDKILGNEELAAAIEQVLFDLIHGKIDQVTQNPEVTAETLARVIIEKLKTIDWETLLLEKLQELLEQLQVDDPEATASELASRMAQKIDAALLQSDLYGRILPILQSIEQETLPVLATKIAEEVFTLVSTVFSEENIYNKTYAVWNAFSRVDSSTVEGVSDTLSNVVVDQFMDADELTTALIPLLTLVDETPLRNLGALAQGIIDSVLVQLVAEINASFPGLNLDPDWAQTKTVLKAVLTTIKASTGESVEESSGALANTLIQLFDVILARGFETAIYKLQEIPSDQAAAVVAAWVSNLLDMAEGPLVSTIEDRLKEIFSKFDAERIAEQLSTLVYFTITELLSEENLYQLILPVLETLNAADMERIATTLLNWLTESEIVNESLDEDQLIAGLTVILQEILGNVEAGELADRLVAALKESDFIQGIDGETLSKLLEFKLYQLLISVGSNNGAIESMEIELIMK